MSKFQTNMYGDSTFVEPIKTKNEPFYHEMRSIDQAFDKYTLQNHLSKKNRSKGRSNLFFTAAVLFLMVGGIVVGSVTGLIQRSDRLDADASSFIFPALGEAPAVDANFPVFYQNGSYEFIKNQDGSVTVKPVK